MDIIRNVYKSSDEEYGESDSEKVENVFIVAVKIGVTKPFAVQDIRDGHRRQKKKKRSPSSYALRLSMNAGLCSRPLFDKCKYH